MEKKVKKKSEKIIIKKKMEKLNKFLLNTKNR